LLTATDAFASREISLGGAATVFKFGFSMKAQKIPETGRRLKEENARRAATAAMVDV
jgi:hypothetical protein